jgi:dihydrofolate reductase
LHEWALTGADAEEAEVGRPAGVNGEVFDEMMSTGAIVAGRGTFELADGWDGDHHDGMPIFILARHEPGIDISQWPLVSYVNDATTAMTQAKEAAGDRNVLVHGAGTTQLALAAGVLDELELHVTPVLFGQGRRLFEGLAPQYIELERTRILGERAVSPTCTTASSAEVGALRLVLSRQMATAPCVPPRSRGSVEGRGEEKTAEALNLTSREDLRWS